MSFRVHREGELEYLTSDVLDGAAHCFSTRFGGDEGRPVALEDPGQNPVSAAFRQVAEQCARVVLDR